MCVYIFAYLQTLTISWGFKIMFFIVFPPNCVVKVIFTLYIFSQILKNANYAKNMNNGLMSTSTVPSLHSKIPCIKWALRFPFMEITTEVTVHNITAVCFLN